MPTRTSSHRWIYRPLVVVLAALTVLAGLVYDAAPAAAAVQVVGEGASFPLIEIEQWRADVALPPYNLRIVYNGTSSGQGRDLFKDGRVDFGVSDIPYPSGTEPGFAFSYVPLSAGGIAFMFNLKDVAGRRVTDLKLTPTTACKIFTGQITKWTDSEIVADNPKFSADYLSNDKVKVIMRSGAAGTSFILGDYCEKLAPAVWRQFTLDGPGWAGGPWSNHPGPPLSQWPAPPGGANAGGSDQNADTVASDATGQGAITAVETGFAIERNIPVASVQNDTGVFVRPTEAAVTTALSYAGKDPRGTQKLVFNPGDAAAYNPSTYSYAIVKTGPGSMAAEKGNVLAQFLNYSAGPGQLKAEQLGYAPLSQNLIDVAFDVIATVAGAPPRSTFLIAGGAGSGGTGGGGGAGGGGAPQDPGSAGGQGGGGGDPAGGAGTPITGGGGSGTAPGGGGGGGSTADASTGATSGPGTAVTTTAPNGGAGKTLVTTKTGAVVKSPARAAGSSNGGGESGGGASEGAGQVALLPFPEQPVGATARDSVLPLGWVLAMGGAGYLYNRRRERSAQG